MLCLAALDGPPTIDMVPIRVLLMIRKFDYSAALLSSVVGFVMGAEMAKPARSTSKPGIVMFGYRPALKS